MTATARVLVFGATGTGKTSLCNVLSGRSRPADSGAIGVTPKSHIYGAFDHQGLRIELVDTVGLHEAESGTVPAEAAVVQLVELLKHSEHGFNLLVHVSKLGRITRQHQEDYDFFVNRMTECRIPVLLVLTGAENEPGWVEKNRHFFDQFKYGQILATCFAAGGPLESHFAPLRQQSREDVLAAIHTLATKSPVKLFGEGTEKTASEFLAKLWNDFVELAGLPGALRAKTNESVYDFMRRIGVSQKIADLAVAHLPDLLGEAASKLPIPGSGRIVKTLAKKVLERVREKLSAAPSN